FQDRAAPETIRAEHRQGHSTKPTIEGFPPRRKPTRRRRSSLHRLLSLTQRPALYETRTGVRISNWNGLRRPLHFSSIRIKGNQDRRNRHRRKENRTDTTRPGTYRRSRLNNRYQ